MQLNKISSSKVLRIIFSVLLVLMLVPVGGLSKIALGEAGDGSIASEPESAVGGGISQTTTYNFKLFSSADDSVDPPLIFSASDQDSGNLPANTYTKDGYTFVGWSNTKDGNDVADDPTTEANESVHAYKFADQAAYNGGQIQTNTSEYVALSAIAQDSVIKLYAIWQPVNDDNSGKKTPTDDSKQNSKNTEILTQDGLSSADSSSSEVLPSQWQDMPEKSFLEGLSALFFKTNDTSESNGAIISDTSATWTTINGVTVPDAQKTNATVTATSNTTQREKFTYKYQLRGEEDFEAGSIQIKIPAKVWITRDGNLIGDMSLSVPAEPSTADTFSYVYDGNNNEYVITNIKKVTKNTAGFMQFMIKHLPAEIADGASTDLKISMTVAANGSNPSETSTTSAIKLTLDTSEQISSVSENSGNVYLTVDEAKNNGLAQTEIEKLTNPDDYIFFRYFSTCKVSGCKPFTLKATSAVDAGYANGVMLETGSTPASSVTKTAFEGYINDGLSKDVYIWSAYPKSSFTGANTTYDISNQVTWDLTEQTESSGTGTVSKSSKITTAVKASYCTPRVFSISLDWVTFGHDDKVPDTQEVYVYRYNTVTRQYVTIKTLTLAKANNWTTQIEDSAQGSFKYSMGEAYPIAWFYNSGYSYTSTSLSLTNTYYEPGEVYPPSSASFDVASTDHNNATLWDYTDNDAYKLSIGKDTSANFFYESNIVGAEYTFEGETSGVQEYYNQILANKFSANGTTLGQSDYQINTVTLNDPSIYTASKIQDESTKSGEGMPWKYNDDPSSHTTLNLYAAKSDGNYLLVATATYANGAYTYDTFNGAIANNNVISLPDGYLYVKEEAATKNARLRTSINVSLDIFAEGAVGTLAKNLLSTTDDIVIKLGANGQGAVLNYFKENKQVSSDYSTSYIHGHNPKVSATSSVSVGDPTYDIENKIATVAVTQTATEQSNIALSDMYNDLVNDGTIPNDSKGVSTFYSLLPLGMHVDTSTVALQSGDSITDIKVISNFRKSGREMLIVAANLGRHISQNYSSGKATGYKSVQQLTYKATMSYFDINVYGNNITVNNVFEGGDEIVGTKTNYKGEPDDPTYGNNAQSVSATEGVATTLTNLDSTTHKESFLYSKGTKTLDPDISGLASLQKTVYADGKDKDDTDKTVRAGQGYNYQIDFTSYGSSTDMVFVDMLENISSTSSFKGTFDYIDVSGIQAAGISPKVYYRTTSALGTDGLYATDDDGNYVDSEGRKEGDEGFTTWQVIDGWTTEEPSDKSTITGIAIDATHDSSGNAVTLAEQKSITANIHMVAPDATSLVDKSTAQNDVFLHYKLNGAAYKGAAAQNTTDNPTVLTADELDINVTTNFDDDSDRDGVRPSEITAELYANGIATGKTIKLNAKNEFKGSFDKLNYAENGEKIEYSVVSTVDKYTTTTKFTDDEHLTINLKHDPELIDVSGTIKWVDDTESVRPANDKINLLNGTSKVSDQTIYAVEGSDTWDFTFTDVYKYENKGQTIDYSVSQDKSITDYITTVSDKTITNTYYPYGDVQIKTTLKDTTFVSSLKIFDYTLELYQSDGTTMLEGSYNYTKSDGSTGTIATNNNFKLGNDQTITIADLPSGTVYKVIQANKDGFTAANESLSSTIVGAKAKVYSDFVNTYHAEITLASEGNVSVTGTNVEAYAFLFNLSQNGTTLKSAINDASGNFKFYLDYTQADVSETEYVYTIAQANRVRSGYTYDTDTYTLKVKVTDNGDGTLTTTYNYYDKDGSKVTSPIFINAYAATGKASIGAYTTLQGGTLAADTFTFDIYTLADDGTATKLNNAKNTDKGIITFADITYNQDATHYDAGETFNYLVMQDQTKLAGYDLSEEYYAFAVTVTDNGDGTLSTDINQYAVTKTAEGKYVKDTSTTDVPQPIFHNKVKDGSLSVTQKIEGDADYAQEFIYHVSLTGEYVPEDGYYDIEKESLTKETVSSSDSDDAEQISSSENNNSDEEQSLLSGPDSNEIASYAVYYDGGYLVFQANTTDEFSGKRGTVKANYALSTWQAGFASTDVPWATYSTNIKYVDFYGTTAYKQTNDYGLLYGLSNLETISNIGNLDVSGCTSLANMFAGCSSLKSVDVSGFNTSSVTSLYGMFSLCTSLTSLDFSNTNWNTNKVTTVAEMFRSCSSLATINLANIKNDDETSGNNMFDGCTSLNKITLGATFKTLKGTGLTTPTDKSYTGSWSNGANPPTTYTTADFIKNYTEASAGVWTALENSYTINFVSGDTSSLGTMSSVTTNVALSYTLPANKFYVLNKVFVGWKDDSTTPKEFANQGTIAANTYESGSTHTLTAQWEDADNSVFIKGGQFDITLHQNEKATLNDIPAGTHYQVYQKTPSGWKLVSTTNNSNNAALTLNESNASTNNFIGSIQSNTNANGTFTDAAITTKSVTDTTNLITSNVTFNGSAADSGAFQFELLDSTSTQVGTAYNTAGGAITFSPITYTAAGTYTYTIKQIAGSSSSITYDPNTVAVSVVVSEDSDGNLSVAAPTYTPTANTFNNTGTKYSTATLTLTDQTGTAVGGKSDQSFGYTLTYFDPATKVTASRDLSVTRGSSLGSAITLNQGTTYTITPKTLPNGWSTSASSNLTGTIGSTATTATINHAYSASGTAQIDAYAALTGGTVTDGQFTFKLHPTTSGTTEADKTAKNGLPDTREKIVDTTGSEINNPNYNVATATFDEITYTAAGTYTYEITEVAGTDTSITYSGEKYVAAVTVTDNYDGTLATSVAYTKSGASASEAKFTNSVVTSTGTLAITNYTNDALSSAAKGVASKVNVSLNDASGNALAGTYKYYSDSACTTEVGSFKNGDTISLPQSTTYYINGLPTGTQYELTQTMNAGFSQTSSTNTKGTIAATAGSAATFTNTYASTGNVILGGTIKVKDASGNDVTLSGDEYSLSLSDSNGTKIMDAYNNASGIASFAAITYTQADVNADGSAMSFTYYVYQNDLGDIAVNTYDSTKYTASVVVTDKGDGTITTAPTYEKQSTELEGTSSLGSDSNPTTTAIFTNVLNAKYTVVHQTEKSDKSGYDTVLTETKYAAANSSVTPEVLNLPGYTAPSTQTETVKVDDSLTITYTYTKNATASYTVNHYLQTFDFTDYVLYETETFTGTPGATTTTSTKEYLGYTAPATQSVLVLADNSAVVNYNYKINQYVVTFDNQGFGTAPAKQTVTFTDKIKKPEDLTEAGYMFGGWYTEPECKTQWDFDNDTMPYEDITLYAKWTANTDTKYTVNHWKLDESGNRPAAPTDFDELTGTTEELTQAVAKNYEGYTAKDFEQQKIKADGSTVVDIEYTTNLTDSIAATSSTSDANLDFVLVVMLALFTSVGSVVFAGRKVRNK